MSTKFLRKTARRLIREFDEFQNSYPSLIRSSDPLNNGIDNQISVDDTKTIVFSTNTVSFPSMTPVGTTNFPSSSINASVLIKSENIEQRPKLPGSVEGFAPFNEKTYNLPATYANTASISLAPGFNVPARNKIAIPIDITAKKEKHLFRLGINETNADPQGYFYGQKSTGFCYYNFNLKEWEDIGLTQNYVGNMGSASPADESTATGQNYFMAQFVGTPNTIPVATFPPTVLTDFLPKYTQFFGYDKIGTPTEFFDAPMAPRYHATSSQGLPLSNYISQPFALERIDVTLPFVARRKHGPIITGARAESSLRDIDNIVFFVYRQSGNINDKLKTVRSLVTHESLTFYNSRINSDVNYTQHNPAYSYDYNIDLASTTEALVTGSVTFTMYPKVTSKNFAGTTALTVYDTVNLKYRRAGILNFWTGPQESVISSSTNGVDGDIGPAGNNDYWRANNTTRTKTTYADEDLRFASNLNPDPRFLTNFATGTLETFARYQLELEKYNSVNWSQYNSPYILLPDDGLVFGLESDICPRMAANGNYTAGLDYSPLSVTSSFFKVLTDQAQVTLYGSLILNGVAKSNNSINQNLVSPAIHEVITNIQDDSDQFDVAETSLFEGTYLDNYITGSIFAGNRAIDRSIINSVDFQSGSFLRAVQLVDNEKTYYQKGPSTIKIGAFPFTTLFDIAYSNPIKPKNYFRYDHYGHYRDMLEQSRDSRIFNKILYKRNGGFEDFGPAYANFVLSSSDVPVSASLTFCNNLSPYMTATFPFDDAATSVSASLSRGVYPTSTINPPFVPSTLIFKT